MKTTTKLGLALAALLAPLAAQAEQAMNKDLNARLPEAIRSAGKMTDVNSGSFPPYQFVEGTNLTGSHRGSVTGCWRAAWCEDRTCHRRRFACIAKRIRRGSLPVLHGAGW